MKRKYKINTDDMDNMHEIYAAGVHSGKKHATPSKKTLEIILSVIENNRDFFSESIVKKQNGNLLLSVICGLNVGIMLILLAILGRIGEI